MATTNAQFIKYVVKYTNIERAKAGLPALTTNNLLNQAAQTHSQNMAIQDFFDHQGEDGKWHDDRIAATGYEADYSSENIATGQTTPKQVVESWMNSSGHRRNILSSEVTQIGVGYYFLENDPGSLQYQHYWTQNFADPNDGQDWWSVFDDFLYGDNGNNTLTGGSGNDYYSDYPGNDLVRGMGGNDRFWNDAGNDTFDGGIGNDTVGEGCQFVDRGNNRFSGGDGNDQVNGGNGKDTLRGDQGNDQVDGGYGQDILYGGSGTDILWGGDYYGSSTDDDKLYGQDGKDFLSGQAGDDYLVGGLGNDYLWSDDGTDTLIGIEPTATQPGKGERDTLNGCEKWDDERDSFILGNAKKVYYNDGDNSKLGLGDYALIESFNADKDLIKLHGKASDYILKKSPSGMPSGQAIYWKTSNKDELIAIVQVDGGGSGLALNSKAFSFV